jgi:SAM-dependent methyltransferase
MTSRPLPPGEAPHRLRRVAESFGGDAERYDRTRPSYPDALLRAVVAAAPGPRVLDVGCGTGIAGRQLQAAGCDVLGVDPDERMARVARRRGLEVEVAAFEDWQPRARRFDAIVAAQTWHWIDPGVGARRAAEALRPGGLLALCWNVVDPAPEIAGALSAAYRRALPDWDPWARPPLRAYDTLLEPVVEGIRRSGAFGEPERWRFGWERVYTRVEWLDQLPTGGDATQLAPADLDRLLGAVGEAIDELGGRLPMRYAAVAVVATSSPGPAPRRA